MKKKIIICIAVVVALVLLIPIPMRLKDGGSVVYQAVLYSVKVTGGGKLKKWSVAKELIDDMTEWVSELDYKKVQFEEGRTPADGEGQAVYSLEFSDGTKFAYYNCGTEHYIRMADTWYQVKNPKLPPAGEPV